jgi:signal transduction histidine kinase/ligand-binding sensor domain-containing protein
MARQEEAWMLGNQVSWSFNLLGAQPLPLFSTDHRYRLLVCIVLVLLLPLRASALDPDRHLSQYAHTAWRTRDGAFGGIPNAITQTRNGYIWIGTNLGLVSFDGVNFTPWSPPRGERLLDPRIFSLLGASDGSLWIGTGYSIARWRNGHLVNYPQMSGRIEALAEDSEGSVWLARTQVTDGKGPVCRMKQDQWQCYGAGDAFNLPYALHLVTSNEGSLWVGGYSEISRWKPGNASFYSGNLGAHTKAVSVLRAIASARDGSLYAVIERSQPRLQIDHFTAQGHSLVDLPGAIATNPEVTRLFVDSDNALWIGTAHTGVYRYLAGKLDHFGAAEGLSSDAIEYFFEDAEGNLWVATSEGIDNLRDLKVASYSLREGLSADSAVSVLGGSDGSVWIGNRDAVDLFRDGKFSVARTGNELHGRYVNTMFMDHEHRLWVGVDNVLWLYDQGRFRNFAAADGKPLGTVIAITEDTNHAIWVREGKQLDRIEDGKLVMKSNSVEISTAFTLAANPKGGIILGRVNGDLLFYRDGATQTIASNESSNTSQIRDLLVEPDGTVWGTTLDEVARWKDGQRKNLNSRNGLPCDGFFALAQDASKALWFYTRCGLLRVSRAELDRWWQQPNSLIQYDQVDPFAGVQPSLTSFKPQLTITPDHKLWWVNGRILQMFDPDASRRNTRPPPVHVEAVVADRRTYDPISGLRLPALTRDIVINYTGLSFVAPQRVFFRYALQGHDKGWQDPGSRRQALYSGLGPGTYTFKVIASNNDGVWNDRGAEFTFTVLPMFYQTWWFRVLYVTAAAAAVWLFYLYRLRLATERVQARIGARMEERERIARELHDTLLQGFQGLVLRFQAVLKVLPEEGPARGMVEKALDRADEVLLEGREKVKELREQGLDVNDLAGLLSRHGAELAQDYPARFTLSVIGTARPLDPIVNNETYRIAREAITNAFLHAHAAHIEVELTYAVSAMTLRVRDDGQGIAENILAAGRSGHWGLSGMRERANKIGATLNLWSRQGTGTEVDLKIPSRFAYPRAERNTLWEKVRQAFRSDS